MLDPELWMGIGVLETRILIQPPSLEEGKVKGLLAEKVKQFLGEIQQLSTREPQYWGTLTLWLDLMEGFPSPHKCSSSPGTNGYPIPDPNPKYFSIPDPYPINFQNHRVFRVSGIRENQVFDMNQCVFF
jgi:hypothetical protein